MLMTRPLREATPAAVFSTIRQSKIAKRQELGLVYTHRLNTWFQVKRSKETSDS